MEVFRAVIQGPLPNILVVGGIIFLLLSVVGKLGARIVIDPSKQRFAGYIGVLLLIVGIGLHLVRPELGKPEQPIRPVIHPEPGGQAQIKEVEDRIQKLQKGIELNIGLQRELESHINRLMPHIETDPDALHEIERLKEKLHVIQMEGGEMKRELSGLRESR